jgi:hypothetical protein
MLDESNHESDGIHPQEKKFELTSKDDEEKEKNPPIEQPNQIILAFRNQDEKSEETEDKNKYPFEED